MPKKTEMTGIFWIHASGGKRTRRGSIQQARGGDGEDGGELFEHHDARVSCPSLKVTVVSPMQPSLETHMLLRPLLLCAQHPQITGEPVLNIHTPIAPGAADKSIDHNLLFTDYNLHPIKMTIVYKEECVSLATHHRIIGVKLITMHDIELELAADIEWSLDIWKANGFETVEDRVIGVGTMIHFDDPDFRRMR